MGRIGRGVRLGLKSLFLHKLRSGLTVLGIVFGVAAVISMLAVGEGSSRDAQERIRQLGATNLIVKSVKPSDESRGPTGMNSIVLNYGLKYGDYTRLLEVVPNIEKSLPIREIRKQVRRRNRFVDGRIVASTADYDDFNHLEMERGRFLSQSDCDKAENFAVLAAETARILFPYHDPVGRSIRLNSDAYRVIGVTRARSASAAVGGSLASQEFNKDVYIPLSTCRSRFGDRIVNFGNGGFSAEETELSQVTLQVRSIDEVRPTHGVIEMVVMPPGSTHAQKKDVEIVVPYDLLLEAQRTARQFSIILGTIASISLLVGGIGIMNIMLATVTERTREIGIRRALGAKRKDITRQFLIETVVLSGVGGLIGVAVGVAIPLAIVYFIPEQKAIVTPQSVLLAFGISVGIGILFGLYPARRAASMDPIDALRHE